MSDVEFGQFHKTEPAPELSPVLYPDIDIRLYTGQTEAEIILGTYHGVGRVDQVELNLWIVGNDHLSYGADVEFTQMAAGMMAERLRPYQPDILFTAASKPLALTFATARLLGHKHVAVARKSISPEPPVIFKTPIRSITSGRAQELMIDGETAAILSGQKVALVDDVISQGDTMNGLKSLTELARGRIEVISAFWLEGAAPYRVFETEYRAGKLVYLSTFPLIAQGQLYNELLEDKAAAEAMFAH